MRTTVSFDPETYEFLTVYASSRGLSLSKATGELIRTARSAQASAPVEICRNAYGFPIFPPTGRTLTSEMVKKLEEEEYDPKDFA